jgi:hypothetical protein
MVILGDGGYLSLLASEAPARDLPQLIGFKLLRRGIDQPPPL